MITRLLLVRATYMYGVVLHAHPVRGESHNQRNTTGEVATEPSRSFCYCWPHYFYLYEVRPPMSSSYIYEILTAKCQPTQNTFKHKLRIHSITPCDITIQIVTHRVDWFSCLAFVLLQYTPARPPNLIFKITCGRPEIPLSKAACGRRLCTVDLGNVRYLKALLVSWASVSTCVFLSINCGDSCLPISST